MKTFLNIASPIAFILTISTALFAQVDANSQPAPKPKAEVAESPSERIECDCCQLGGAAQTAAIILALDIDKDGIISASEIKNASSSLMALDFNSDGRLSRSEMHATNPARSAATASSPTKLSHIAGVTPLYYADQMMAKYDSNGDNLLQRSEMNEATLRLLPVLDVNRDQQLSKEEIMNLIQRIRQRPTGKAAGTPAPGQPTRAK